MKTSDLTGPALDWAVAKCEGVEVTYLDDGITRCLLCTPSGRFNPSTNWSKGGPIIEQEHIQVSPSRQWLVCHTNHKWAAVRIKHNTDATDFQHGPTPLIAAMRCYVASKLGDEVEIPSSLYQQTEFHREVE